MKKWKKWLILPVLIGILLYSGEVLAAEGIDEYDYTEIQQYLDETLADSDIRFQDMLSSLLTGNFSEAFSQIGQMAKSALLTEVKTNQTVLHQVLMIGLFGALLTQIASALSKNGVGEAGFYVTYLLLMALLLVAFQTSVSIGSQVIGRLLNFMSVVIPVFFAAVAFAGGSMSALAFYELILLIISVVQWLFLNILLPMIDVYVTLLLVNSLSKEDYLSRLAELLKSILNWLLKTLLGVVVGLNLVQGLVLPMVDSVKSATVRKAISAIPWIGKGGDAVASVLLGSGALIKNGIGMAALVFLVLLCLVPLIKLSIISALYQGSAAAIQPVSDPRIVACISSVYEGTKLVLKLVLYTLILFVVSVAIICAASNSNYYAG